MPTPVSPKITDHTTRALARMPGYQQGSTLLRSIVRATTSEIQPLEDTLDDVINKRAISTGEGVQLDNVGTILNLARRIGQSDASYVSDLRGRASVMSVGSGTAEQLIQIFLILYGGSIGDAAYADLGNATAELFVEVVDDGDPTDENVINAMGAVKAAGVKLSLGILTPPLFLFGTEADADANGDLPASINGWGDETDADVNGDILPGVGGGNFTRILRLP